MTSDPRLVSKVALLATAMAVLAIASVRLRADTGSCGTVSVTIPFTDVPTSNIFFCAIAEAYFSGLTNGTSATTYSPSDPVPREQMAAFVTRTMDQSLKRGSQRAALDQYWTTQGANNLTLTGVGDGPSLVKSDGSDLWVSNLGSGTVSRVRASDGKLLETWTGAPGAYGVLVAMGKVFVTGQIHPGGRLYMIDPTQTAGAVSTVTSTLGDIPVGVAYDGEKIWTANFGTGPDAGSVSIISLNPTSVTTVATGFNQPQGILFDGSNVWVTDFGDNTLKKLNSAGGILQSVSVGTHPGFPAFDGTNIWVPNSNSNSFSVVRAPTGAMIATLSGNGLSFPLTAAFDGERILVTNVFGNSASLWKATDLTRIGTFSTGVSTSPWGACSDGLNFWITLQATDKVARF
jgi:hypothetical protein